MPKAKEYFKVTCTCDKTPLEAYAICEESRIAEFKKQAMRAIVDFIDADVATISVSVEQTKEVPEYGTDIVITPHKQSSLMHDLQRTDDTMIADVDE